MARTTASKSAGLDLLDRLYCSQILVHLLFDEEEVEWLDRITNRVNAAVQSRAEAGVRAERIKQMVLCLLEIYLGDDIDQLARKLNVKLPQLSSDLSQEDISKVRRHRLESFAAFVLAIAEGPEDRDVVFDVVNELLGDFASAPATVRFRLVERVLSWEFPNAPITVFAWLAKMGIVRPAKYNGRAAISHIDAGVVRAVSLCEFEMFRSGVHARLEAQNGQPWTRFLLKNFSDRIPSEVKTRLVDGMQAEERRRLLPHLSVRVRKLLELKLMDAPYLEGFFTDCHSLAPYVRKAIHKQSSALSDIAAVMIAIRAKRDSKRARYIEESEESIAHDVKRELNGHGFEVNARSIYRHYSQSLLVHAESLENYHIMIASGDTAIPAEYGDIFHFHQIAFYS